MDKHEIHEFWIRVKNTAYEKGITMTSVYQTLGLVPNNAYGWSKHDILPPVDIAIKMAWILNVDIAYLLWGENPPQREDLVIATRIRSKAENSGNKELLERVKNLEEQLKLIRDNIGGLNC